MKLVTAEQMRNIELSAVDAGVSLNSLMENAGLAVAEFVRARHSNLFGMRIEILVGPGNNGGDGLVVGRHLSAWGANVSVSIAGKRPDSDPKLDCLDTDRTKIFRLADGNQISEFRTRLQSTDLIVDAVLGTGNNRPIGDDLAEIIFAATESAVPVYAIDLPTGLNSDTGHFDIRGFPADVTLQLGFPKIGPALRAADAPTGEIQVLDIGIPSDADVYLNTVLLDDQYVASIYPSRESGGHKGSFGKTLVLAGSETYPGAFSLATEAAVRSGCGYTFAASTSTPIHATLPGVPEALYSKLAADGSGSISPISATQIFELAQGASSMVIGPGLSNTPATKQLLGILIEQLPDQLPLVLDADALNALSDTHTWVSRLKNRRILTPHAAELARLMNTTTANVLNDRLGAATTAANELNSTVILKGPSTIIAARDGRVCVSPWVNSGLAQGGSGDVLAGLMGGLLAQSPDEPFEMAAVALYVHGYAANIARTDIGEQAMTASDVTGRLGEFYRQEIQPNLY